MQKGERQEALLEIIREFPALNQLELAKRLCDRGFKVTQASVSRDLDELGIEKKSGKYVEPRPVALSENFGPVDFDTSGDSLVVGRCPSGLASAVTVRIDSMAIAGVVGTIAGDDTVFIAVKGRNEQAEVLASLTKIFGKRR